MRQALAGRRQHAEVGYIKICNGFVNVFVSIKSQMYFINASSLIFQTLVYFKGNLVHMFFYSFILNSSNVVFEELFDVQEDTRT